MQKDVACWVRAWLVIMRDTIRVEETWLWLRMGVVGTEDGCGQD